MKKELQDKSFKLAIFCEQDYEETLSFLTEEARRNFEEGMVYGADKYAGSITGVELPVDPEWIEEYSWMRGWDSFYKKLGDS